MLSLINVGIGVDCPKRELVYNFKGNRICGRSKSGGTSSKLVDATKIDDLGSAFKIFIEEGLRPTCFWHMEN